MGPILVIETKKIVSMTGVSSVESSIVPNIINLLQFFSSKSISTTDVVATDMQLVDYNAIADKTFTMVDDLLIIHHSIGTSIMVNAPPCNIYFLPTNLPNLSYHISVSPNISKNEKEFFFTHENLPSRR